ncbi:hypothetical protein WN943_001757 [Citrus x changshan-huyou]
MVVTKACMVMAAARTTPVTAAIEQNRVSKCRTRRDDADCRVPRGDGDRLTVGASRR